MGRRRHVKKTKPLIKRYRINNAILVREVKLIDPDEGMVGVVPIEEALKRAYEKNLDLVEISPKEVPPVVKMLDFGKFKYSLEKKAKVKTKKVGTKGIRLTLNMASHDLETREKQGKKFIEEGHKLQMEIFLRGRQAEHAPRAFDQIKKFIERFSECTDTVQPAIRKGRKITASLQ